MSGVTHREIIARALALAAAGRSLDDLDGWWRAEMYAQTDSILADLDKRGLCIVPKEATDEMVYAHPGLVVFGKGRNVEEIHAGYEAMISAAPK